MENKILIKNTLNKFKLYIMMGIENRIENKIQTQLKG